MKTYEEIHSTAKLKSDKWIHYFDIYDQYFNKFRNKSPTMVEVGVYDGGSIETWVEYFGEGANVYGIDIEPRVGSIEGAKLFQGDQGDPQFWDAFLQQVPLIDCFVDDGSHHMEHQILTFMKVWPHISEGGVYICEDTHTSYWPSHGGGFQQPGTFIEFMKQFIDGLQMRWIEGRVPQGEVKKYMDEIGFIGFHPSMVVLTKGKKEYVRTRPELAFI